MTVVKTSSESISVNIRRSLELISLKFSAHSSNTAILRDGRRQHYQHDHNPFIVAGASEDYQEVFGGKPRV